MWPRSVKQCGVSAAKQGGVPFFGPFFLSLPEIFGNDFGCLCLKFPRSIPHLINFPDDMITAGIHRTRCTGSCWPGTTENRHKSLIPWIPSNSIK